MNLHMWYICRRDTCIFKIFSCIRKIQIYWWIIRHYRRHNFLFMCSSGRCLQNDLHKNVAVTGGEREYSIQRRASGAANEW